MSKFKVGDRVTVKKCLDNQYLIGKSGEIINYNSYNNEVLVKFDEAHTSLHGGTLMGFELKNRCWYFYNTDTLLKKEEIDVITIKRSGNTLIVFDNVNHKKAIAKCSPEDDFDLKTGVKLAIDRLFENEKPKYYTGKVVCVDSGDMTFYTKGKIYTIKDGTLTRDDSSNLFGIPSVDELNRCSNGKWLEVVE